MLVLTLVTDELAALDVDRPIFLKRHFKLGECRRPRSCTDFWGA
jgi:hypothetical protein